MPSRHFISAWFVVAAVVVISGCASANRTPAEYFEPSGDANIISVPPSGPKNVAVVTYGPNASMNVRAVMVEQSGASVSMVLALKPGATPLTFTNRRVVFEAGGTREEREGMWDASLIDNNRPRTERVPFTTELKPPSVTGAVPKEGAFHLGIYQCTLIVPIGFQNAREFRLIIPAVAGGNPTTLNFVRRTRP
jgi:hypothetical protein